MKTLARATDPITSVMAAQRAKLFNGAHQERILCALSMLGTAAAKEIGQLSGLTVVQVDRRLPELKKIGRVKVLMKAGEEIIRDGYRVWRLKHGQS